METVILKALLHRTQECIGIFFTKNKLLENAVRSQPGAKWSHTNKCWYIPLTQTGYGLLIKALKDKAVVNNELLKAYLQQKKKVEKTLPALQQPENKKAKPADKPVALTSAWQLSTANAEALAAFVQQLQLKAYSPSTIKTYRNEFMQLLQLIKHKPVNDLTAADIKRYMVYAMEKEGISENTAHSRLNAFHPVGLKN